METTTYSDIFFLISSVGFVILFIVFAVLLYYLIKAVRAFKELTEKIERKFEDIGDAGVDLIDDVRTSSAFRFFFRQRRSKWSKLLDNF